jgi:hypothetical protein
MKALKKDAVLQSDDVESAMLERDICKLGNKNPFLANLHCSFQNEVPNILIKRTIVRIKFRLFCYKGIFILFDGFYKWWGSNVSYSGNKKVF